MFRKIFCLILFLALASCALAQNYTAVTATVTDPNGIPYAGAQLKAQLVLSSGGGGIGQPTVTVSSQAQCTAGGYGTAPCQVPFSGTVGPVTLDGGGNIPGGGINLQTNSAVTPSGTQWLVTVFTSGVPPPFGTGPHTFSALITISGASQSISSNLNAVAPTLVIGANTLVGNPATITGTALSSGSAIGTIIGTNNSYVSGDAILQLQNNGPARVNFGIGSTSTNDVFWPASGQQIAFCPTPACTSYIALASNGIASLSGAAGSTLTGFSISLVSLADSTTAPTISSGFGTSPSIVANTANGTRTFQVNVGTGGTATSGVISFPAASHGWGCAVTDMTSNIVTRVTAFTTTTMTVTAASAWAASDVLLFSGCAGF